jgi:hypothetical protein
MSNQDYEIHKRASVISIVFLTIIGVLITIFTIKYINNEIELLKQNEFQEKSIFIKKEVEKLQSSKMNSVMTIPLTLSQDTLFQNYLEQKIDINLHKKLQKLSYSFKKYTPYKNVWIQVINKNGVSLARSWTNKTNDSIYNIRKDIRDMIKSPHIMSRISVGKFTESFKSIVPIFNDKKEFLGMIEVSTHFNSIVKTLKQDGFETLVLADKKYKSQLTHNVSHFIKLIL